MSLQAVIEKAAEMLRQQMPRAFRAYEPYVSEDVARAVLIAGFREASIQHRSNGHMFYAYALRREANALEAETTDDKG